MRIKVLPPHGSDRSALDERSWAELPEGATVRDVLRLVRCSPLKARLPDISFVRVDGVKRLWYTGQRTDRGLGPWR